MRHAYDGTVVERVCNVLLGVFRFKKFTDSRWVTLGDACRTLAAGSLGLRGLVDLVRADKTTSDYYIHGFDQLDASALRYAAIAALASNVADDRLHRGRLPLRGIHD